MASLDFFFFFFFQLLPSRQLIHVALGVVRPLCILLETLTIGVGNFNNWVESFTFWVGNFNIWGQKAVREISTIITFTNSSRLYLNRTRALVQCGGSIAYSNCSKADRLHEQERPDPMGEHISSPPPPRFLATPFLS